MGWETRQRGGRYYTRSRKVNGRVVREYVGTGRFADLAAAQDVAEREERSVAMASLRKEQERLAPAEMALAELDVVVEDLARAALVGAGYHRHHRGAWRKRRHGDGQATEE
jgi:hypothetical protein